MSITRWVLLPGLDGSGRLFQWFRPYLPDNATIVVYPAEADWQIDDYVRHVLGALPPQPCMIIAESFSGPIALRVLQRCANIAGLVLVASFATCPHPVLRLAPPSWLGKLRGALRSRYVLRALCLGWKAPRERVDALQEVVDALATPVLLARLPLLRELDATKDLHASGVPILQLKATRDRLIVSELDPGGRSPKLQTASIDGPHFLLQACPQEAWGAIDIWRRALR